MIKATISGFYDEASFNINEQIALIKQLGEEYLCPRQIGKKTITNYTFAEFRDNIYPLLAKHNIKFSSIGSSLGKIRIDDEAGYQKQLEQLKELIEICKLTNCKYIRIFSFFGCLIEPEKHLPQVIKKLNGFLELTKDTGIVLLHENEKEIYGDTPERVLQIYNALKDKGLQLIYDASNFIQCDIDPLDAYNQLKEYVVYYHIKDCDASSKVEVPVGLGDGKYKEIFADLSKRNYQGFMTLEPHTAKYALLKMPAYVIGWIPLLAKINKTAKTFRKIDKHLGKGAFQSVSRKEVFVAQYSNLKQLISEVNK